MDANERDFREIVTLNIKILGIFGILPYRIKFSTSGIAYMALVTVLTGLFFGGIVVSQLINMVLSFQKDIEEIATSSYLTLTAAFSAIKSFCLFVNRKRILFLISSVNRKEFKPKNRHQVNILADYIRTSKVLTVSLILNSFLVCGFWTVYPLIAEDGPFLPIPSYVPYNIDNKFNFAVTYVGEAIGVNVSAWCCLTADGLISGLIMVICAQLSLLNDTLENLHLYSANEITETGAPVPSNILEETMLKNLIKCVRHHQLILKFTKEVESIFTIATFGQFFISVLILCTALFKLASLKDVNMEFVSTILFIFNVSCEVFVFCYFGNQLIAKHNELAVSAYQCEWRERSIVFKKNLIFFMAKCQKPLRLLAGGYVTLSLETFVAIMKSSVSYFTVLNQVNDS